jgi:superfamily II DNA or RNA helicase
MPVDQLDNEDEPLTAAYGWAECLWESATEVPGPRFAVNADVITLGEGQESVVRRRRFVSGAWSYELRIGGRTQHVHESALDDMPESGEPTDWVCAEPSSVERFGATLTRGKLETALTDTVFSFRATRTVFRPYQFKPVLRLLQTGATRVLIADEVGLGKTIEAGLIWTELEARRAADRVLIIAPSSLVGKWQEEMAERFGFSLVELDNPGLNSFLEQHMQDQVPRRVAYVTSLERLRMWPGLENLVDVPPQFDLIVVDEAHAMRNPDTKSHSLGEQINDWADSRVFLTATPVNLGNSDLSSILELLAPEDFNDPHVLELRLEPNAVLHRLEALLLQRGATARDRLDVLKDLQKMKFGQALMSRPGFGSLKQVVAREQLTPADVVEARQHLSELNALSSVITRTRKVEIDEHKALREPRMIEVSWTDDEIEFYTAYVDWCVKRAAAVNMPLHFAMQMPLRLASACLPAARNAVLGAAEGWKPVDEDAGDRPSVPEGPAPHSELILAASNLQDGVDSKYDRLLPIILELIEQNKQVLLFTFSRPTLAYLRERLSAHARVAVLHGGVPRADRRRVMAEFRRGKFDLLLANRVASEGLDFEFCSAVINYDLPWNPMEVEQRIGRIDRIGQREQKILVINFYNEATIDERILTRVLERIGVFERAIGALEPIIQSQLPALQEAVFDFRLSPAQRQAKADQILTAIEGKRVEAERLVDATSDLLVSNSVDVAGLEGDLVRGGRYVGQVELAHLLHDWATTAKAPGIVALDDSKVRLHGNVVMSEQLRDVARRGVRMRAELNELAEALRDEVDLTLLLDQEAARVSGGDLLTATHPLVLAAVAVPGHRQARFANIRVRDVEGLAPPGHYAVILALASGSGDRATREIWGAAVDTDGRVAADAVPASLLAALAGGGLQTAESPLDQSDLVGLVDIATDSLHQRHAAEQERRDREADALLEARRISLKEQLERRLDAIDRRMATARSRGRGGLQMFEGQRRRAMERHHEAMRSLDQGGQQKLSMSWLAACCLEIVS